MLNKLLHWLLGTKQNLSLNTECENTYTLTEKALFKSAFEQICADIVFENVPKEQVFTILYQSLSSPQYGEKALQQLDLTFNWPWFDEWLAFFENYGEFPYMWRRFVRKKYFYPKNIDEVCERFTVQDMKITLKQKGIPCQNGNRATIESTFKTHLHYEDLSEEINTVMQRYGWDTTNPYQKLKIILLVHTVHFCFYNMRNSNECPKYRLSFINDGCIEEYIVLHYIKPKQENGRYQQLPPYFPGGRCGIHCIWKEK